MSRITTKLQLSCCSFLLFLIDVGVKVSSYGVTTPRLTLPHGAAAMGSHSFFPSGPPSLALASGGLVYINMSDLSQATAATLKEPAPYPLLQRLFYHQDAAPVTW
jgi:hypothetical protein